MPKDMNTKKCVHANINMYKEFVLRSGNEIYELESHAKHASQPHNSRECGASNALEGRLVSEIVQYYLSVNML